MNTYRVSYQNHLDATVRNKHTRVKAYTVEQAKNIVELLIGSHVAIYKVQLI